MHSPYRQAGVDIIGRCILDVLEPCACIYAAMGSHSLGKYAFPSHLLISVFSDFPDLVEPKPHLNRLCSQVKDPSTIMLCLRVCVLSLVGVLNEFLRTLSVIHIYDPVIQEERC